MHEEWTARRTSGTDVARVSRDNHDEIISRHMTIVSVISLIPFFVFESNVFNPIFRVNCSCKEPGVGSVVPGPGKNKIYCS